VIWRGRQEFDGCRSKRRRHEADPTIFCHRPRGATGLQTAKEDGDINTEIPGAAIRRRTELGNPDAKIVLLSPQRGHNNVVNHTIGKVTS
jgi:hypothetical protein